MSGRDLPEVRRQITGSGEYVASDVPPRVIRWRALDGMPLSPGSRLGHYEIQSLRGAGGMGEVYRSRDVRLNRTVALKILPSHFASDPEFRERFEREARSVAALSHPHICALYDVGEVPNPEGHHDQPVPFLVMEYLEGETLAEALNRKPLPMPEVLRTSIEIANAMDRAHRAGVVHRDLKPGNIMLTPSGAKLLDFGLAKVRQPAFTGDGLSTTARTPLTARGAILGTPNYMAPEQVEGKEADHRTDIFALGAIVYEMVTGRKAFEGPSAASVMAAIVDRDPPPLTAVQPLASAMLEHVVARCLAKNPDERWQSAGDVMRELEWTMQPSADSAASSLPIAPRQRWWPFAATLAWALIATVVAAVSSTRRQSVELPEQRLDMATPPTQDSLSLAISPDGEKVVFVATTDGRSQLWLRYLNSLSAQPLPGTESPQFPFWAPDSRSVGFGSSGWLKRIDLDGGAVRNLANAPLFLGGTWNTDGTILFVPNTNSRVLRVPDGGGEPVAVSPPLDPSDHHHFPHVLPDGRHYLFYRLAPSHTAIRGVYMAGVDGTAPRRLIDADASAFYAEGRLLFVRQGKLLAQRFDPSSGILDGPVAEVADQIATGGFAGATVVAASASRSGTIAYRTGDVGSTVRTDLKWVDRFGNVLERINSSGIVMNAALSPDGRRIAWFSAADIWLYDLTSRISSRFTFDPASDFAAIWSPDGRRIAFGSNRSGVFDLYVKNATGEGTEELLLSTAEHKLPTDWSADGKFVLFRNPKTTFDVWAVSVADRKPFPIARTPFEERDGQFSPDGKWIAYQSNESGRFEIWVRPFPALGSDVKPDERWQLTTSGATQVRWGHDGNAIFYVGADGRLMAMPVSVDPGGRAISHGAPVSLFQVGVPPYGGGTALPWYAISRDSQRFLTTTFPQSLSSNPIRLLLNWHPQR
jgi:eukaryotic-like serine/threonine-protein kinase